MRYFIAKNGFVAEVTFLTAYIFDFFYLKIHATIMNW